MAPVLTKEALDRAIPTLESLRESLHTIKSVLEKAQASTAFPQSSIDAYQQKTNEWLTNVEQSLANASGGGVRANRLAIDVFENTRILKVTGLHDAVRLAQKNLELLQSGKNIATNASKKISMRFRQRLLSNNKLLNYLNKLWNESKRHVSHL